MPIFRDHPFQPVPNVTHYQSLYTHMREAILSGELKSGMKLPSTRALANELNLSRNTVLNAYRQLLTEGYLEGRACSGTFVAYVLPETLLTAPRRFDTFKASHSNPEAAPDQKDESPRILFSDHAQPRIENYR